MNSRNHRFDPLEWLHEIEPVFIQQLHIVGYSCQKTRFVDDHSQPVQPELLELARAVRDYAPAKAIILERDADFPTDALMDAEIAKLTRPVNTGDSQPCERPIAVPMPSRRPVEVLRFLPAARASVPRRN